MSKFELFDETKHLIKWETIIKRADIDPISFRSQVYRYISLERKLKLLDELEKSLVELKEICLKYRESAQNKPT